MLREKAPYLLLGIGTIGLLVLPIIVEKFLRKIKMVRPNFQGKEIPVGFGLFPILWSVPLFIALGFLKREEQHIYSCFAILIGGMGLLGFIDDRWGDRTSTGLRGHFKRFIDGEITTGFVKAAGGIALSICVFRYSLDQNWSTSIVSGTIVALSANMLNLLDLRPGRASGSFLTVSFLLTAVMVFRHHIIIQLVLLLVPVIVLHERDSRARAMMGDTGSNSLGAALGLAATLLFPSWLAHGIMLSVLIALHLVAEKISFTKVIAANPFLSRMDKLFGIR